MLVLLASVVSVAILVLVSYVIGGISGDMAVEKGYDWDKTFNISFAMSLFGFGLYALLLVKSKPDLKLRQRVDRLAHALENQTQL